jgi:hypothetical protein
MEAQTQQSVSLGDSLTDGVTKVQRGKLKFSVAHSLSVAEPRWLAFSSFLKDSLWQKGGEVEGALRLSQVRGGSGADEGKGGISRNHTSPSLSAGKILNARICSVNPTNSHQVGHSHLSWKCHT